MTNERLQSLFTLPMDEQLRLFGDMSTLYPTRPVRRGRSVSEILIGKPIDLLYRGNGEDRDIDGFMQRYRAAGLLILKRGAVVCEPRPWPDTRNALDLVLHGEVDLIDAGWCGYPGWLDCQHR